MSSSSPTQHRLAVQPDDLLELPAEGGLEDFAVVGDPDGLRIATDAQ